MIKFMSWDILGKDFSPCQEVHDKIGERVDLSMQNVLFEIAEVLRSEVLSRDDFRTLSNI